MRPGAPIRDAAALLLYGCMAVYGFLLYGLGPALDALRDALQVSRAEIGVAGSALAAGGIVAALVARRVMAVSGPANLVRATLLLFGGGAVLLILAGHTAVAAAATACIGAGGGLLLVAVPVLVEDRQPGARAAVLAEANACAALAGVAAPLAVGAATLTGLGWEMGIAIGIPMVVALGLLVPRSGLGTTTGHETRRREGGGMPGAYWRWLGVLVVVVGIEFCVVFWAPDYLQQETGMRRGAAGAALGVFVLGMALGRIAGGRLAVRRAPEHILAGGLTLALTGFTLFWLGLSGPASVAGLLVTGFGVSVLYPMALSLAMRAVPADPEAASVRASLGSGTAILVAPFALAATADAVGVRPAFALVYALVAVGLLLTLTAPGLRAARVG